MATEIAEIAPAAVRASGKPSNGAQPSGAMDVAARR